MVGNAWSSARARSVNQRSKACSKPAPAFGSLRLKLLLRYANGPGWEGLNLFCAHMPSLIWKACFSRWSLLRRVHSMNGSIAMLSSVGYFATWSTCQISVTSFIPQSCGVVTCRSQFRLPDKVRRSHRKSVNSLRSNLVPVTHPGSQNWERRENSSWLATSIVSASWICCTLSPARKQSKQLWPKASNSPHKGNTHEGQGLSGGRGAGRSRTSYAQGAPRPSHCGRSLV